MKAQMRYSLMVSMFLFFCSAAYGGVVWDESVNGDLPQAPSLWPTVSFTLGVNEVVGSSFFAANPCCDSDLDDFKFTLPSGTRLQAITYNAVASVIPLIPGTPTFMQVTYFVLDASMPSFPVLDIELKLANNTGSGSPVNIPFTLDGLNLHSPEYVWFNNGMGISSGANGAWTYEIDFLVTAIPEPGTFTLLGLGLASLAFSKRRSTVIVARARTLEWLR